MDYLKIPYSLIYKNRNDLKDFGVQTPDTMNYLLFMYLKQQALMGVPGAREVALRCFNNAYYICTLILLEANDFPELRISDYVDKILEIEKGKGYVDEVCLASMAMACLLLAKYDEKRYGTDSEIWKKIYHRCTHYQWYHSSATEIFLNMMSLKYSFSFPLSNTEFEPRNIIEAIEEASPLNLAIGHKYICNSLSNVTDRRKAIYGADLAISRLNDDLREIYEDWEYNPDTDSFEYEDELMRDLDSEQRVRDGIEIRKSAVEYIIEHFPTKENTNNENKKESVNDKIQNNINGHQSDDETLRQQLADAQKTIAEQTQTINEQQAELERLNTLNEVLNNQIERFEVDTPEMDIDEDTALSIKESIIFFSSIMGCNLSKEDISQTNLARLISKFTQRPKESIRPKIVDINTERENNAKNHTAFSDGVHQAAVNVCALIENAMEGLNKNPLPHSCKQAVENIRNIYKSPGRNIELHEIAEAKKNLKKI